MKLSIRWSLALLALALVSACNPSASSSDPAAAAAAPSQAPAVAEPAPEVQPQPAADEAGFVLTMADVEAYFLAQKQLALASQADPTLEDLAMNVSEEDGVQYAARLEANPRVRTIITDAGLSTREFALTGETLMTALMAQGALEAGLVSEIPAGLDPASVEFVKQNKARIEELMSATGAK